MIYRTAALFCGGGGTSQGMLKAANARGIRLDLMAVNHWSVAVARTVDDPLPTITTARCGAFGLCEPFLVEYHGNHEGLKDGDGRVKSVDEPLPVVTTENRFGLCQPFVVQVAHEGGDRVRSIEEPLPTIPAGHRGELAVCEPFVTKYYGTSKSARPVTSPLDTITTKDRFALVESTRYDILFRMLQPHELAAAMGFDAYHFEGNRTEVVKQIGNAVSVRAHGRGPLWFNLRWN